MEKHSDGDLSQVNTINQINAMHYNREVLWSDL